MAGRETTNGDRAEQGNGIAVIGLALLVADLLVIFFAPAALKVQRGSVFVSLIAVLAVVGLALVIWGRGQRRRAS